jgi:flagellar biosynthesis protein FlhG
MANLAAPQRTVLLDGLADLESQSDLILVDTGAGLGEGVTSFVSAADLALVVVTPEPTSIADAYALIKCVSRLPSPPNVALVANLCRDEDEGFAVHARVAATAKKFLHMNLPLLGVVRRDDTVARAVRVRTPCLLGTPRAKASRDIASVAEQLAAKLQLKAPSPKPSGPSGGLLGRLLGR